jgi:hypothetical protein
MTAPGLGVAVIGAGMAGRAHAVGYRSATTVFASDLPDVTDCGAAAVHGQHPAVRQAPSE